MSLRDDFFDDKESCSTEHANLDAVTPFDLLLPFFRDDIQGLVFPPLPLFFVSDW